MKMFKLPLKRCGIGLPAVAGKQEVDFYLSLSETYSYTFQTPIANAQPYQFDYSAGYNEQGAGVYDQGGYDQQAAYPQATAINPATGQEWDYNSKEYAGELCK